MPCFSSGGWQRNIATWFGDFSNGGGYAYPNVTEGTAQAIASNPRHGSTFNPALRWPPRPFNRGQLPTAPLEFTF